MGHRVGFRSVFVLLCLCLIFYASYSVLSSDSVSHLTVSSWKEDSDSCSRDGKSHVAGKLCDDNAAQHKNENQAVTEGDVQNENVDFVVKDEGRIDPENVKSSDSDGNVNVLITFTKATSNTELQRKFGVTVESLFRHASRHVSLYILGDNSSQKIAQEILSQQVADSSKYTLSQLDVDVLSKQVEEVVRPMQMQFSSKAGSYYNDILFYMSISIHKIMPLTMKRLIMLDCDLKFNADVSELYSLFDSFTPDNIMGIAREAQPVYRHTFWQYRQKHPGTRVGEPPPDGLTGFNSGVLLVDLDHMRASQLYNSLLSQASITELSTEFGFKGHLGDQDFYTLLSMKHEKLFFVLACRWNRQLCQWWHRGYEDVFDLYYRCDGPIAIYHGNCNTPIP